jgi:hypothetical protein
MASQGIGWLFLSVAASAAAKMRDRRQSKRQGNRGKQHFPQRHEHRVLLEHDPEKWIPVFGKDHAKTKI